MQKASHRHHEPTKKMISICHVYKCKDAHVAALTEAALADKMRDNLSGMIYTQKAIYFQ